MGQFCNTDYDKRQLHYTGRYSYGKLIQKNCTFFNFEKMTIKTFFYGYLSKSSLTPPTLPQSSTPPPSFDGLKQVRGGVGGGGGHSLHSVGDPQLPYPEENFPSTSQKKSSTANVKKIKIFKSVLAEPEPCEPYDFYLSELEPELSGIIRLRLRP